MPWEVALNYITGLRWLDPRMDTATFVRTAFVVNTCDAMLCRLFAANNGYSKNLWTVLGFVFGMWAVALILILPKRSPAP